MLSLITKCKNLHTATVYLQIFVAVINFYTQNSDYGSHSASWLFHEMALLAVNASLVPRLSHAEMK